METILLIAVVVLLGGTLVLGAWATWTINNLRKDLKSFDSRIEGIENSISEQQKALQALQDRQKESPWTPLLNSLGALAEIPKRGLWPVIARIALGAVQSYGPTRRSQKSLPKRNTGTES
ncbi:MAG: hypothetical protein KF812_06355 [Fimbriimonadaceae bacterium]|nr:hypothetical protein [Fimbriimonadaceae bacterium]